LSRNDITGVMMGGTRVGGWDDGAEGRKPDAKIPAAKFLCMRRPAGVLCVLARGRFLCESAPAQFSIIQQRSYTMAKKAKKKKAKKKKKK